MKQPRQWYGVAMRSGSVALQKRLHIHPLSEGLSPGCSHPGCRNYQNPSKGRGCLSQLSPLDPKDPQSHMFEDATRGGQGVAASEQGKSHHMGDLLSTGHGCSFGNQCSQTPGLVHICTCPAPLALQTQEQQEPGGEVGQCPQPLLGISSTLPHQSPSSWPLLHVWAPVLLGLVWGWSQTYFPEIADGIYSSFCSYNCAIWPLGRGLSGGHVSAEILWDSLC